MAGTVLYQDHVIEQIISAPRNHLLISTNTWTSDSRWLVFGIRSSGASFIGETTERVNIHTDEVEVIYRAPQGAYVGVVTVHPKSGKYVFIHGPENPDKTWYYDFHHRCGVIVEGGKVSNPDAMDITAPYTLGALRGGSHVHAFSLNGERVSFTYNDHVMHGLNPALDLRNVGVAAPFGPTNIQKQHPCEYNGSHWCVLVNKTVPMPQPGNDEINRAYKEEWVGNHALAFTDGTFPAEGEKMPELSIVELPEDETGWKTTGDAPLGRTETTLLAPPCDVVQRHLAFTHHRACPGLVSVPHHWIRYNPRSTQIAFLMRDDNGIVQLWFTSP